MRRPLLFFALTLVGIATPQASVAQTEISARAATLRLGGRLHAQYAASSIGAAQDDFFFRRVRLIADLSLSDFVSARVQPDFAGGTAALQDAYARLDFSDGFRLSVGQFKRAFDIFELSSSTDLSLVERDGRIEGLSACSGVGGVCSYSRLSEKLEYAGRDQGIKVEGASGRVSYQATLTNGTGINVADENDGKSFSGRATFAATEDVRVSGQLGLHDYVDPAGDDASALAWGGDVEYGTWRNGLHVQAALLGGKNWEVLDASDDPVGFLTFQAVASFYHPVARSRIEAIEPLARISFGDPDRSVGDDGALLLTPGFMVYLQGRSKIGFNLDVYAPQTGDTEYSLKVQTFLYF